MNYEYVLYQTDTSFDYGDFPGGCYCSLTPTGFTVDIDRYDNVDLESLEGFGDLQGFENDIKTHKQLYDFIEQHKGDIEDYDPRIFTKIKNIELFEELKEILNDNIKRTC